MNRFWKTTTLATTVLLLSVTMVMAAPETNAAGEQAEPQLLNPIKTGLVTSITTLVVFLSLLVILSKFAWGPITKGLAAREAKIRGDIQEAEYARASADAKLKEYDLRLANADVQVREMLNRATVDAERLATNIKMQAQQDVEQVKERAVREIEVAKKDALKEIYAQTATLATNVAEKILRRNLNADDQRDLVNASLDQLQSVSRN